MKIYLFIFSLLLLGCTPSTPIHTPTNKKYTPVDKSLLTNIKPYGQTEPTLKEKLERQNYSECMERIKKSQDHSDSLIQAILDSYSCSN